jgi:hypothetical protein
MRSGVLLLLAACGATPAATTATRPAARADAPAAMPADAPGADYLGYRKVTDRPYRSRVHGDRWVDVYVTAEAADAYLGEGDIPVGATIVKAATDGAIFVMQKRAPGYAPQHGDWYYALHWPSPPPEQRKRFGATVDWRSPSPRVAYCWECHDDYDRSLGGLTPSSLLPR